MQPTEVILKSSSKKEFEDKIKAQQPTKNEITNDTN
jgi:hypothetical protein